MRNSPWKAFVLIHALALGAAWMVAAWVDHATRDKISATATQLHLFPLKAQDQKVGDGH